MTSRYLITLASLLGLSCSNKTVQVKTSEPLPNEKMAVYYTLPRTVVYVNIYSNQSYFIPGPYAEFAKKFLGIEGVSSTEKAEYSISRVEIETHLESDPNTLFAVYPSAKGYSNYLKLSSEGLVLPVNHTVDSKTVVKEMDQASINDHVFKDLSVNPFIVQENTTYYGRNLRDSVYVRVPIQRSMTVERNLEEKAKEAADFIFSLRKKRLDMLSPDIEHPLTGEALQVILKELQRLEDEYLSLFTGKKFTNYQLQTFCFIPSNPQGESSILFRFSDSKGVLPTSDLSGRPILIELDQPEYPGNVDIVKNSVETYASKVKLDRFYYRIPVVTNVRLVDGKQQLATRRVSVYQYGIVAQLPVNFPQR